MAIRVSAKDLKNKIEKCQAKVAVVGMGYVGLPLSLGFAEAGFLTFGFDTNKNRVLRLARGISPIHYLSSSRINSVLRKHKFVPTYDTKILNDADCIVICVPTPLTKNREPDLGMIKGASEAVVKHLRQGQLIVLESTSYPGTTEEVLLPILLKSGLKQTKDFWVAFSPEREDPGNKRYHISSIPKIVGGIDKVSGELASALYGKIVRKVIPVSSTRVAEATKILENTYRAVNVALVNELKMLFTRMGINVWEVINAASTKPFGFQSFYPGPGLGGHCIPVDPFYLSWKARSYDFQTQFIELAGEINTRMPEYVLERTIAALNEQEKCLKGARILVLGVAYKRDIEDVRESPALTFIRLLEQNGAMVSYYDPMVPVLPASHGIAREYRSCSLSAKTVRESDCVVIITDHTNVDYGLVAKNAKIIVDTRFVIKNTSKVKGYLRRA